MNRNPYAPAVSKVVICEEIVGVGTAHLYTIVRNVGAEIRAVMHQCVMID